MSRKRGLLSIALGLTLFTSLVVPVALADPPTRTFVPSPTFSGSFCPAFDVQVTAIVNREYAISFSNGATIITGHFVEELTNLTTGKTIQVNASGPLFVTADGSTVTLRGRTLLFGEAGDFGPGSPPTTTLLSGVAVITLGPDGTVTSLTTTGHSEDLCATLADP
jgi:hypothetical protein